MVLAHSPRRPPWPRTQYDDKLFLAGEQEVNTFAHLPSRIVEVEEER